MSFGLSEQTVAKIQSVFEHFPQVEKVVIYGSRAKGNFKKGSDIDLTIIGQALDQRLCDDIAEALDDLLLPYMIDLSIFELLKHSALEEHIQRVGQTIYQRVEVEE